MKGEMMKKNQKQVDEDAVRLKRELSDAVFWDSARAQERAKFFEAARNSGLRRTSEAQAFGKINPLCDENPSKAVELALEQPFTYLRALVLLNPTWPFNQPEIANFIGNLYWQANYGPKGDELTRECRELLKSFLLPRAKGAHPWRNRAFVREWFKVELQRARKVLEGINRKMLRQSWEDWKQKRHEHTEALNKKLRAERKPELLDSEVKSNEELREIMATDYLWTYGVYPQGADIQHAVDSRQRDVRAYVVIRTAENFGISEREVRKFVADIQ